MFTNWKKSFSSRLCLLFPIVGVVASLFTFLLLRVPGVRAGLPYMINGDEPLIMTNAFNMVTGDLLPTHFSYGPVFYYIMVLATLVGYFIGLVSGELYSPADLSVDMFLPNNGYYTTAPQAFVMARSFGLLASLATAILMLLLCRKFLGSVLAGSLSVLLLAANSHDMYYSSAIARPDVYFQFFTLAIVYFLLNYLILSSGRTGRNWNLFMSGLFAGLLAGLKYNSAIVILGLFSYALVIKFFINRRALGRDFPPLVSGVIVGFSPAIPALLLRFDYFLWNFTYEMRHYYVAGEAGHPWSGSPLGQLNRVIDFFSSAFVNTPFVSVPIMVLAVFGLVASLGMHIYNLRVSPSPSSRHLTPGDTKRELITVTMFLVALGPNVYQNVSTKLLLFQNLSPSHSLLALLAVAGGLQLIRILNKLSLPDLPFPLQIHSGKRHLGYSLIFLALLVTAYSRGFFPHVRDKESREQLMDYINAAVPLNARVAVLDTIHLAPTRLTDKVVMPIVSSEQLLTHPIWFQALDYLVVNVPDEKMDRVLKQMGAKQVVRFGSGGLGAGNISADPPLRLVKLDIRTETYEIRPGEIVYLPRGLYVPFLTVSANYAFDTGSANVVLEAFFGQDVIVRSERFSVYGLRQQTFVLPPIVFDDSVDRVELVQTNFTGSKYYLYNNSIRVHRIIAVRVSGALPLSLEKFTGYPEEFQEMAEAHLVASGDFLMAWNGTISSPPELLNSGVYVLQMEAHGQPALGENPEMAVEVSITGNGGERRVIAMDVFSVGAQTSVYSSSPFELASQATVVVSISFSNDYGAPDGDRNLFIRGVWIAYEPSE